MSKPLKRWPIWKLAVSTAGCALLCPVLFWLSAVVERLSGEQTPDPLGPAPVLTLSSLVAMFAVVCAILAVVGVVFLVMRMRDARTPAWKKQSRKKRY